MAKLKIAIVISTTRAARFGHKPAQWVHDIAAQRDDIETEIIDLRDFPMPFFDEVASNAWAPSQNPVAQRWQKKVAEFDGFIGIESRMNAAIYHPRAHRAGQISHLIAAQGVACMNADSNNVTFIKRIRI